MGTTQMFYAIKKTKYFNESESLKYALINGAISEYNDYDDIPDDLIALRKQINYEKFGSKGYNENANRLKLIEMEFTERSDIATNTIKEVCNIENEFIYNYLPVSMLEKVYDTLLLKQKNSLNELEKRYGKYYKKQLDRAIGLLNDVLNEDYKDDLDKYYIYFRVV